VSNPENVIPHKFKKGESGNPNGRPKGDIVIDLFGGSGSTLIACEDTGRDCYMMELDPKYIDVIIERYENHTGKKAKQLTDEK